MTIQEMAEEFRRRRAAFNAAIERLRKAGDTSTYLYEDIQEHAAAFLDEVEPGGDTTIEVLLAAL